MPKALTKFEHLGSKINFGHRRQSKFYEVVDNFNKP